MHVRRLLSPGPLAVALSLAVHAVLFLGMFMTDRSGRLSAGESPVAVDTRVWAEEPAPVSPPTAAPPAAEEESEVVVKILPPTEAGTGAGGTAEGDPTSTAGKGEGPAGAGTGTRVESRLFPEARQAQRVVYVIDRSLSMGLHGALSGACRELLTSLDELSPEAVFQVVFYNRDAAWLTLDGRRSWLRADDDVKRRVADFTAGLRAEGATDHLQALRLALSAQPDVIFFVTDADDMTPAGVRSLTSLNNGRTVIHTIELNSAHEEHEGPLRDLSRTNRGTHRLVDPQALSE